MRKLLRQVFVLVFAGSWVVLCYEWASEDFRETCGSVSATDQCETNGSQDCTVCNPDQARYFAAQTITTVGWGSGLRLGHVSMQRVAVFWAFVGASVFSFFIAALSRILS